MRKSILLLSISVFLNLNCTSMESQTKGIESEGYLMFVGNPDNYKEGVQVYVGEQIQFDAKVYRENDKNVNETLYAIPKGSHQVEIFYNGKKIHEKLIFISIKETKVIYL